MIYLIQYQNKRNHTLKHQKKETNWYNCKTTKTIIIVCLLMYFQLSVSSCKTCKCPAYSKFSIQNSLGW